MIENCKALEYLKIFDGFSLVQLVQEAPFTPKLKTLIITADSKVTLQAVTYLLAQCTQLNRAEFHNVFSHDSNPDWKGDFSGLCHLIINHTFSSCSIATLPVVSNII